MTDTAADSSSSDRRALLVVLLGLVVIFAPLFLLPAPGDAGPVAVVVGLMQAVAAGVGLVVAAAGIYSHRTGDRRPAVAAAATVIGLAGVGLIGALVELGTGRLVPIGGWLLAAVAVILGAFGLTHRFVPPPES